MCTLVLTIVMLSSVGLLQCALQDECALEILQEVEDNHGHGTLQELTERWEKGLLRNGE